MNKTITFSLSALLLAPLPAMADHTVIDGMDFGPLAQLVGSWKSVDSGGVDISPAQEGTAQGKGAPAITPFYETMTFEVAADAVNASEQTLVACITNKKFSEKRTILSSMISEVTSSMIRKTKSFITPFVYHAQHASLQKVPLATI